MRRYCVIGYPIGHSLSAVFQNAAFKKIGEDAEYTACEVKPGDLGIFMRTFKKQYAGANVTVPYKEEIIPFLNDLDEEAKMIGAVNTIVNHKGKLIGYNTDAYGAMKALHMESRPDPRKLRVIIIGAGGAAKAIAFACVKAGSQVTILNRTVAHAGGLAKRLNELRVELKLPLFNIVTYGSPDDFNVEHCDILINATSCGMSPRENETPVDLFRDRSELSKTNFTVMDIVYKPLKTKLLLDAEKIGAEIITGDTMLLFQDARSFELWTGKTAPLEAMEGALRRYHQ